VSTTYLRSYSLSLATVAALVTLAGCPAEENPIVTNAPDAVTDLPTLELPTVDVVVDVTATPDAVPDGSPPDAVADANPPDGTTASDATDPEIPDNPAPPDVVPDGPCEPDCDGKVCGNDGCGGICGYCPYPTVCDAAGQCAEVCVSDCEGKFCGTDGCGGTCGDCPDGLECGEVDGLCYEPTCVPDCTGKVCGSDGCGADCGQCASPQICQNGSCQLGPCGTITDTGECDGTVLKWCEDQVFLNEDDCSQYDFACTYDGQLGKYTCKEAGACIPNCTNKECGSDGCGSQCGACNNNWSCVLGACTPEEGGACGPFQGVNGCIGDDLWLCQPSGALTKVECNVAPFYEKCDFDFTQGKYACVPN